MPAEYTVVEVHVDKDLSTDQLNLFTLLQSYYE